MKPAMIADPDDIPQSKLELVSQEESVPEDYNYVSTYVPFKHEDLATADRLIGF